MELRDYLEILTRRKWIVLVTLVVTVTVVAFLNYMTIRVYSASTLVRVTQIQSEAVDFYTLTYAERLMNTYVYLLKSTPFLEEAITRLKLDISADLLDKSVEVKTLPSTELLQITAESASPQLAMDIANTMAQLLVEERENFYTGPGKSTIEILQEQIANTEQKIAEDRALLQTLLDSRSPAANTTSIQELNTRIRVEEQSLASLLNDYETASVADLARANSVSIVQAAEMPQSPTKPKVGQNMIIGLLAGLLGGVGLAFVYQNLSQTIDSTSELQSATNLPLVGTIPRLRGIPLFHKNTFPVGNADHNAGQEAFRSLKLNLFDMPGASSPCTLLITSAEPRAGKSTILANLSFILADRSHPVIAIDSDLLNPWLHRIFHVSLRPGLTDLLRDPALVNGVLQLSDNPYLKLISSGETTKDPTELLERPETEEVLSSLRDHASVILFDSPPLLASVDARILAKMVDKVLIVVRQGQTGIDELEKAIAQLDGVGGADIGIVFNAATQGQATYYYRHALET